MIALVYDSIIRSVDSLPRSTDFLQRRILTYLTGNAHLHGSPCKDRPRLFPRAHKREASGGISGTNYSPKVSLKGCEKGPD